MSTFGIPDDSILAQRLRDGFTEAGRRDRVLSGRIGAIDVSLSDIPALIYPGLELALVAGTGVTLTPDEPAKTITITASTNALTLGGQNSAYHLARANHTGTQQANTISDLLETTQDTIAQTLVAGANISLTYDDPAGTITIAASGGGGGVTPSALTKTDDTNVTLALGGTPATALLQAVSLTLGWTGQLSISRGGTNASSASAARTNLGLAIGTDVQAYDVKLATIAGFTLTGNGGKVVAVNSGGTAFELATAGGGAPASAGAIGSVIIAAWNAQPANTILAIGDTVAGSELVVNNRRANDLGTPVSLSGYGAGDGYVVGAHPSYLDSAGMTGTWRCLSRAERTNGSIYYPLVLWQRIA